MTQITCYESVSAVTFSDIKAGNSFISEVLHAVAEAGINIDMISSTPPKSERFSFAFSFSDDDIPSLLTVMSKITAVHNITPFVNSGNVKLVIKNKEMEIHAGFAARVLEITEKVGADVLLITTSADEISLLVPESYADELTEGFKTLD
ncbi:MAG: ACT domain-containing protein [Ruminiclostridium sp.]|nr:ACT domain-containing protein [Ruminiclostridium sp.]